MFDTQELKAPSLAADAPTAVPMPPAGGGQTVHILDRLNAVFKHRRIAGTAFLLVVLAMMVQSYSTIPTYQTRVQIEIEDERSTSVGNLGINDPTWWQDSEQYYRTQYQKLRSRELGRRVVRRLDLASHPEFNGSAPRPRDPVTLLRQARASASAWIRGLIARPTQAGVPAPLPDEGEREAALISALLGPVDVRPVQGTRLVDVYYTHTNPEFAAQAANALAEEYRQQNLDERLESVESKLKFVDEQLGKTNDDLKAAETALAAYRDQHNAQSLNDRQNILGAQLTALNTESIRAQSDRIAKQNAYGQVRGADPASDTADSFPLIGTSRGVVEARNEVLRLRAEKATLSQRYGPQMPQMIAVEQQLSAAQQLLVAERAKVIQAARNDYEASLNAERSFTSQLEQAKTAVNELEKKGGDYNILQRQVETIKTLYDSLLEQKKQLEVVANSRANNVRISDRAEVNRTPVSPNPRRDWLTALLAGLTIALGLAFGIEYLDDSVKTPEDVTRRLRLPLLGLVPAVRGERVPILSQTVPHDFGEAFRSLRTSLVFTSGGESTRVIAVTSSQPLEGKTTTACNLALALALGGSRVLLIDADMRRPGLHKTIGLQNGLGLSHLLVGQSRVREVIQRTGEPNLFVITAGRTPPNPSELLASERMNHLVANLEHGPFDWVVIDTPPILAVTDAVIVAQRVSGVVFVVGSEMTRRVHAERAIETLQSGRARSIGVVLNRVDFDRNKYYYSRYYGYHYKSYYGQNSAA